VSSAILDALARTAARRFQSFAEAATSVLDLLHAAAPGERLALVQIDWAERTCRVIDARGDDGSLGGVVLPLAARYASADGVEVSELLDPGALASLGFDRFSAALIDASDGSTVGVLLATGEGPHVPVLAVAARLLSYEWETVSATAELRTEVERLRALRARTAEADTLGAALEDAHERLDDLADADRRAEQARQACAEMRAESERQAELSAQNERELRAKLATAQVELETMSQRFDDLADAIATARRGGR
jgi:hypothetical protein